MRLTTRTTAVTVRRQEDRRRRSPGHQVPHRYQRSRVGAPLFVFFGRFDATVFVEFLTKLVHDAPGPVYLILDNLSVHKARIVKITWTHSTAD